ncbi:MAG: ABC transporter permease [Phycisphaerales bacterium]
MSRAWAIATREYAAFFRLPLGWVVTALFIALSSVFFTRSTLVPGEPATMRDFFGMWWGLLLVICPAISMRLFSEEHRSGTIETVLTAPVSEAALVFGKHAAGVMFLLTMLAPSLVYVALLGWLARPDYGPIATGYLGLALLGSLYLAIGSLASSLTASQTLAFLATLFALVALDILPRQVAGALPEQLGRLVGNIAPSLRMADFARGLINSAHAAYFLILSFWFLAVCTVILQSRRWR